MSDPQLGQLKQTVEEPMTPVREGLKMLQDAQFKEFRNQNKELE